MAILKTYENWIRGEFVFHETHVQESDGNGLVESINKDKVAYLEFTKIEKAQIEIGLKQKKERLEKAKSEFSTRFKNAISKQEMFFLELKSIENILLGKVPKQYIIHFSETFGFTLTRSQLDGISQFYFEAIENEDLDNYRFIASPLVFPFTNEAAPQGLAYFLFDLYNWLIELKEGKLDRLIDFESHKYFPIVLAFADGTIYNWLKDGFRFEECARRLNVSKYRTNLSESYSSGLTSPKSIFLRPTLISDVIEYCELFGIELHPEFVKTCNEVKSRKAK